MHVHPQIAKSSSTKCKEIIIVIFLNMPKMLNMKRLQTKLKRPTPPQEISLKPISKQPTPSD
jgi:hypothetical protein